VTGPGPGGASLPGRFGIWVNPSYDDEARTRFVIEAEALGYPAAWLGFGRQPASDLALVERILKATSAITVATGILNMWTNDPRQVAASYRRIAAAYGDRFLLGIGIGHPESVTGYRQPCATMVDYLDKLDADGVPAERRILAALGPKALRLAADRTVGTHPYLVVPDHTRAARHLLGPGTVIAPEHKVVVGADPATARAVGRAFVSDPYLKLSNYTTNLQRYGYTDADITGGGSDRLIDALVLHGSPETVAAGLRAHLDAGPTMSRSRRSPMETRIRCSPTGSWHACLDARLRRPSAARDPSDLAAAARDITAMLAAVALRASRV
jgi:probable F420-dependent oxidoreductase